MLWIVGFFVVYVLVLFAITWISLHPPRIPTYLSPGALDVPQLDCDFESDENILRAWWVEAPQSDLVMVFVHGYMMNRSELTPEAAHWWRKGISGFLFDQRAHGRSGGRKCGFGVFEKADVAASVRKVREQKPKAKIVLVGSSMGSAAIALAMADDPSLADALILDSCYSRLTSATLGWWRFLGGNLLMAILSPTTILAAPFTGFNPFRVDIAEAMSKLDQIPVLFLHGDRDNLALASQAQRNIDAHRGPHSVTWFEGCGHSEGRWLQPEKYRLAISEFLGQHGLS